MGGSVPFDALAAGAPLPARYSVRRRLKSGNGVETLLAADLRDGREVVVKVIDPAGLPPAARLRFEHEATVLRHLAGAGLAGLHDAGAHGDRLYLVQPFVSGPGLHEVLARGPLPLPDVLRIGIDLAQALEVAHGAGICHRDVKPANVVLDAAAPVGRATLIDFGSPAARGWTRASATTWSGRCATSRPSRRASCRHRPTSGPTCTPSGWCCSSAWPGTRPSPGRAPATCCAST